MSTIIKASSPSVDDVPSFKFEDLTERGTEYLDKVRRQASQIMAQAQADAIVIRREAEGEGKAAGHAAAQQALEEAVARQMSTFVPAVREAIDRIQSARAGWLAHWEKTAIHVATAIAARVIRREVSNHPEITLTLIREALELAAGSSEIELHLHPADIKTLGAQVEQLTGQLARVGKACIIADAQIAQGACRVDTRYGVIDQQFEAQLVRIEHELS